MASFLQCAGSAYCCATPILQHAERCSEVFRHGRDRSFTPSRHTCSMFHAKRHCFPPLVHRIPVVLRYSLHMLRTRLAVDQAPYGCRRHALLSTYGHHVISLMRHIVIKFKPPRAVWLTRLCASGNAICMAQHIWLAEWRVDICYTGC